MATRFAEKVQRHVSKGWRIESRKLGQLWDVERNGVVALHRFPAIVTHWNKLSDVELEPVSYIYRVRADRTRLRMGDMLLGLDKATRYEASALLERYTLVSMRLLHDNIAIRTDDRCHVYRMQQTTVAGVVPSYNFESVENATVLVRDNAGAWSFAAPGTPPTDVWAGIVQGSRGHRLEHLREIPLNTQQLGWVLSLALLPGVTFREGDIFVDSDGDRYIIDRPYYQIEGAVVNQLHATRLRV